MRLEGQPVESPEGQAHGLGRYPFGSEGPLKVIKQGSDVCPNWMAELVPGWKEFGWGACGENQEGRRLGFSVS